MKITINNLERFINFNKLYYQDLIETCSKKPDENKNSIYLKILNELYIKNRKEIIEKELKKGSQEWMFAKCNLEGPYRISISDDNKNSDFVEWKENIFDITIEKLEELLKNNNKKYLSLYSSCDSWINQSPIVEIEI